MKLTLPALDLLLKKKQQPDARREMYERRCTSLTERLRDIRNAFDMSPDDDTTDALIYEENAVLCRLSALYKQARAEGITLEIYERRR